MKLLLAVQQPPCSAHKKKTNQGVIRLVLVRGRICSLPFFQFSGGCWQSVEFFDFQKELWSLPPSLHGFPLCVPICIPFPSKDLSLNLGPILIQDALISGQLNCKDPFCKQGHTYGFLGLGHGQPIVGG